MPLQRSRSKSKSKDKKSSTDDKKDKKVVKKSSVKSTSSDGKVSQVSKQSVVVNVGDVATKKKRGRPRKRSAPAQTAPPRFVEPPQSGLVQQAPQQIYQPPPFPSQNMVQPQPQRDALAPKLPTSASVRQTLDEAQSEARVQAQNQARIEAQRRLQQQSRSVGGVEPSDRLKKQQEARLKKLVPADAPKVDPPPKVAPPKVAPPKVDPNPLSGESKTEITDKPTDKDVVSIAMTRLPKKALQAERSKSRERQGQIDLLTQQLQEQEKQRQEEKDQHQQTLFELEARLASSQLGSITPSVGRSQPSSTLVTHPLQQEMRKKFELPPPYQVEVTDQPSAQARYSSDVPFAQAQPVERDPMSLTFEKLPADFIREALAVRRDQFKLDMGRDPNFTEDQDLRQLAEQDVFQPAPAVV